MLLHLIKEKLYKKRKIAVVIPCYKVSKIINKVINKIPKFVDKVYVIDDACPENSVKKIKSNNGIALK